MNTKLTVVAVAIVTSASLWASDLITWRPMSAQYTIFSGDELSPREEPTAKDRKLTIAITGKPAKEIFDSIGPDAPTSCGQNQGNRDRNKEGIQCTFNPNKSETAYRCWIGLDLKTGQSISTISC
jgi:hypothetical protein